MPVTTEDVEEGVKQLWTGNATLAALVAAPIIGRIPDAQTSPYTSLTVTDKDADPNAGGAYFQKFLIEFKTWDEAGAANAGAIKVAIENVFSSLVATSPIAVRTVLTLASGRTLAILRSLKQPGTLNEDPATQKGQAVKVSEDKYEFLCQG